MSETSLDSDLGSEYSQSVTFSSHHCIPIVVKNLLNDDEIWSNLEAGHTNYLKTRHVCPSFAERSNVYCLELTKTIRGSKSTNPKSLNKL